jgi:replicative DNA helicase
MFEEKEEDFFELIEELGESKKAHSEGVKAEEAMAELEKEVEVEKKEAVAPVEKPRESPDKLPPQRAGLQEEIVLLSGFIQDPFLLEQAQKKGLKPFFFRSVHGKTLASVLFEMVERAQSSEEVTINKNTVKEELIRKGLFSSDMEEFYDEVLTTSLPSLSVAMAYIEILKTRIAREQLYSINKSIEEYLAGKGESKNKEIGDFAGELANLLTGLQRLHFKEVILPVKYRVYEMSKEISSTQVSQKTTIGFPFEEFPILSEALSGLRKGFYYGLAGAPRRGKTNFALTLAAGIAGTNRIPVLYYSWEQTQKILTYRLLGRESMLNPALLQSGALEKVKNASQKIKDAIKKMEKYMDYLFILEGGREDTFERIAAHAYNIMHEFGTTDVAIFIDYLQKMPLPGHYIEPQLRINTISSGLAELSLKLNAPIFAISSLDKEGCKLDEKESRDKPTMHHCAGSGDIEYDLDVAMVISIDWYETAELHNQLARFTEARSIPSERIPKLHIINVTIDKNRDAPSGVSPIIQYLFFIEENKLLELGYKKLEEEHTYTKIAKLLRRLIDERWIFPEEDLGKDIGIIGKEETIL